MGYSEIHAQAGRDGFVTTSSVRDQDVTLGAWSRHGRRLGWAPYHRAVWVPAGVELDYRQRIDAALAVITEDVLVTGGAALFLDGILNDPPANVELVLPTGRHLAARKGVCLHRSTTFSDIRFHHQGDVRIAAVARAFADYAQHADVNSLCRDIASALRQRRCTLAEVGKELARRKRFPGRAHLRVAHALLTGEISHSACEGLGRRLLATATPSPHPRPLPIEIGGRLVAEIDIAFPTLRYGVEIDGPHHLLPNVAAADRTRDRTLDSAGWTIDRFFWFELEDRPDWFVAEVTRRLASLASG